MSKLLEQADGRSKRSLRRGDYHRHLKKAKIRHERRRANQDPECAPLYGRYAGWET